MVDRERSIADEMRRRRREGIKLIVVSSVFVLVGAVIAFGPGHPIGLVCLLFFGGCLLVGIMQVVGEERLVGRILLVVAAGGDRGRGGREPSATTPAVTVLCDPRRPRRRDPATMGG